MALGLPGPARVTHALLWDLHVVDLDLRQLHRRHGVGRGCGKLHSQHMHPTDPDSSLCHS